MIHTMILRLILYYIFCKTFLSHQRRYFNSTGTLAYAIVFIIYILQKKELKFELAYLRTLRANHYSHIADC